MRNGVCVECCPELWELLLAKDIFESFGDRKFSTPAADLDRRGRLEFFVRPFWDSAEFCLQLLSKHLHTNISVGSLRGFKAGTSGSRPEPWELF